MKHPIEWHKDNVNNARAYLKSKQEDLNRLIADINRIQADLEAYESQIEVAVRKGRDGFDRDKFGQIRVKVS